MFALPSALVFSSHVAVNRVGGSAQALALAAFGIEAGVVPTVLFGRHPGLGPPGGGAVPDETFTGMLEGIGPDGGFVAAELAITGYFASAGQVNATATALKHCTRAKIVVDPILGDTEKGLYVRPEVAKAMTRLILHADVITPNAWELGYLAGQPVTDAASAVEAARQLGKATLVSSIDCGDDIGVVYADRDGAYLAAHKKLEGVPNGCGDLLTALFAALLREKLGPDERLRRAVGGVVLAIETMIQQDDIDLPLAALGARLKDEPAHVRVEKIA